VDKAVDRRNAALVDLTIARPCRVPVSGFAVVEGVWSYGPKYQRHGLFLVPLPGPSRRVRIPDDAYLEFAELTKLDEIRDFSCRYGPLRIDKYHFHRVATGEPEMGERISDWLHEAQRLRDTLNLWDAYRKKNHQWIRRFLEPVFSGQRRWSLNRPVKCPEDPIQCAEKVIITTVSMSLSPCDRWEPPCCFPGCGYTDGQVRTDSTYACLQSVEGGSPEFVVGSSNLSKTLWLQAAGAVAGQRKVKKCEAPDCGRYMDVTSSSRPGGRRMHESCSERLKKQRYRKKKRRQLS
jgi:hypothetical protein